MNDTYAAKQNSSVHVSMYKMNLHIIDSTSSWKYI